MTPLPIELSNIRVFDVLRNALSSELGSVVGVEGDKIDLVVGTGAIVRFKYGAHFSRVGEDEAIAFRAVNAASYAACRAGSVNRRRCVQSMPTRASWSPALR